jgi:hypothetical protein
MTTRLNRTTGPGANAVDQIEPVTTRPAGRPNTQLGRSGYVQDPKSELAEVVLHLDALQCFMAGIDDNGNFTFTQVNPEVQGGLLGLASRLAADAHQLIADITASPSTLEKPC